LYSITIERRCSQRSGEKKIQKDLDYFAEKALKGRPTWKLARCFQTRQIKKARNGFWVFSYCLVFEKVRGQKGGDAEYKQWSALQNIIETYAGGTRFGKFPWRVTSVNEGEVPPKAEVQEPWSEYENPPKDSPEDTPPDDTSDPPKEKEKMDGVRNITTPDSVTPWSELSFPQELLSQDGALAENEHFKDIYGRDAQIRTVLSAIQAGIESGGARRQHVVLWGHAACGKTSVLTAIGELLGPGAILRLDATSTTRAGLENMIFKELKTIPPIVFCEEVEKGDENALKIWLGALDDRGEIRKVKYKMNSVREFKILFICTVNNKQKFDAMMGSDGNEAGALSSRCVTDVYFPRPDETILRMILQRDIRKNGGKEEWVEPAIQLAKDMGKIVSKEIIDDPRRVLSFLAGGDRLPGDGKYQKDRLEIYQTMQEYENQ